MASGHASLISELELLRSMTSSDFIALAPLPDNAEPIRWKYARGNSNNRYQQMVIKKSIGLAGTALRLGRWVKLDETNPRYRQEKSECPVMLAEQLQTAAVFPLTASPGSQMKGLLFIGKRVLAGYEPSELLAVQEKINALASYLQEFKEETAK
jgi:nitrogen regulatory protein A